MPELPEIESYLAALRPRIQGTVLERVRVASFSLLRTYDPPVEAVAGKRIVGLGRLGKRIVIDLEDDLHIVIHLMVAGRLHWMGPGAAIPKRQGLAAFDFAIGTLLLTEAGSTRRATMHVVRHDGVAALDPGGAELSDLELDGFRERLTRERHTLKRTLTDARLFSGIGGAFADEILWEAKLSPTQMNTNLDDDEVAGLFTAARSVMDEWTRIRIEETGEGFPTKVTAFHPEMAVHGKYRQPCPRCGAPIQRIVHGERETNYCPGCQTGGKILADRALSRLLKDDWPRTLEELEG
ncbi:MAG: formamidopyrimidine-DNA glycosylase [Actinobacteria bacterium]|nr:MAG: formamidopyrimidine-DNA glycosylase [Actinomycetota bacterium]